MHGVSQFVGVYSDLLFQPWLCASLGICPEWLDRCNIDRRSNLSVEVRCCSPRDTALRQSMRQSVLCRSKSTSSAACAAQAAAQVRVGLTPNRASSRGAVSGKSKARAQQSQEQRNRVRLCGASFEPARRRTQTETGMASRRTLYKSTRSRIGL